MGVERDQAAGVLQVNRDAAEALAADCDDGAGCGGMDQGTRRSGQVHTVMEPGWSMRTEGVPPAEWRRDAGRGDGRQQRWLRVGS